MALIKLEYFQAKILGVGWGEQHIPLQLMKKMEANMRPHSGFKDTRSHIFSELHNNLVISNVLNNCII